MGTVLAGVCRLLLDAPECRGRLRSSEAAIVASLSSWKLHFLVGRLIGVCSLLTSMQNSGSKPVFGVGAARWPDGPPQSGVAHGFSLIPVNDFGVAVEEVKTGRNAENSGTPRSDMVADGLTLEKHKESLKYLEPMQVHWMNCAMCNTQREKCAHACVRWGVICTPPVAFVAVATVWTRTLSEKKKKTDENARLQEEIRTEVDFGNIRNSIRPQQVSLSWSEHESVVPRSDHLFHHFLSCHPSGCHSCHWWSQCGELHHVALSVHVEDEDDEKCCCQLKLNHSKCCWTVGSNVLRCLVLKGNGIRGTPLPWSCWRLTRACADGLYCSRAHKGPAWGLGSTLLM